MKSFAAVVFAAACAALVLVAAVLAGPPGPGEEAAVAACKSQFPNSAAGLDTFATTGQASDELKCYMRCILMARGKMAANGTVEAPNPPKDAPTPMPEAVLAAIKPCFQQAPTADLCETAYTLTKCLRDKDPQGGFLGIFRA